MEVRPSPAISIVGNVDLEVTFAEPKGARSLRRLSRGSGEGSSSVAGSVPELPNSIDEASSAAKKGVSG